jgi:hypothetical protein
MHQVGDAWEVLERAGVPLGAPSAERPELGDMKVVAGAVRAVLAARRSSARQRVSLLAWLSAWASEWPTSFRGAFGEDAAEVLATAGEGVDDRDRYLKLRRLSRDKLASVL